MKILRFIFPFFVAVVFISFLFSRIDKQMLLKLWVDANIGIVFASVIVLLFGHFFSILRWKYLLSCIKIRISLKEAIKIYFANLPVAKWAPAYSGDFLRAFYIKDHLSITEGAL